jgi:Fanconi anemia group I protein
MRSYEKDSSISNPIKLDVCVENANNGGYPKIVEPIHILLANLVKALNAASTENTTSLTSETIVRFKSCMESFIDRLSKASLEDFELDKTANFDMATHLGLRNNLYANLVLGIYEVTDRQYIQPKHRLDNSVYVDFNGVCSFGEWYYR